MAIAVDQANLGSQATDGALSSIAFTTSATVAASGFVTVEVFWFSPSVTLSSVSGGGLTWTIDVQTASNSSHVAHVSAQAPSGLASGTTITATFSGSTGGGNAICGTSWTGVASSTPVDVTSAANNTSSTAWSTPSMTIATGSLLIGAAGNDNTYVTSTPDSPATELHDFGVSPTGYGCTVAYRLPGTSGSYTVSGQWTTSAITAGQATGVAYKVASGGATKSITPAAITATSAVTASVQALKHITGSSITATSAVSGAVTALKHIVTAAVSATSAVTGSLRALRAVLPASVTATSAVTGSLRALHAIAGAAANATSNVTGAITGGAVASVIENVRDYFASVFHYHGH